MPAVLQKQVADLSPSAERPSLALLTTWPPTRCGIALHSHSLVQGFQAAGLPTPRIAVVTRDRVVAPEADWFLHPDSPTDYSTLATDVSAACDALVVQHEYGLYGGENGELLLNLLRSLAVPAVLILHTVVKPQSPSLLDLTRRLLDAASLLILPGSVAAERLTSYYGPLRTPIVLIPHGLQWSPTSQRGRQQSRQRLGVPEDIHLVVTSGFVTRNKGIDTALEALAVAEYGEVPLRYVIVGGRHPEDKDGRAYERELRTLRQRLDLGDRVTLIGQYLPESVVEDWIRAADLCLFPYRNLEQVSSGVLARSLGLGKAALATPFAHARELLQDVPQCLVAADAVGVSRGLSDLLSDRSQLVGLEAWAERSAAAHSWSTVALRLLEAVRSVVKC